MKLAQMRWHFQDEVEAAAATLKLTDQCDDSDYDSEYSESDTD